MILLQEQQLDLHIGTSYAQVTSVNVGTSFEVTTAETLIDRITQIIDGMILILCLQSIET
jgi:hypothetical protein